MACRSPSTAPIKLPRLCCRQMTGFLYRRSESREFCGSERQLLQRFPFGLVLGGFLVEKSYQLLSTSGSLHLPQSNDVLRTYLLTIQLCVGAPIGAQGRTFQR